MNNVLKSLSALVVSCLMMLNVNAMQDQERLECKKEEPVHKIGQGCYCKVIRYPEFSRAVKLIDIDVSYKGKEKRTYDIYLYAIPRDRGLSMYSIAERLGATFKKMPEDIRIQIAKQCYEDVEQCYLENLSNNKNS